MIDALRRHWPEYLMEAALLAAFMISASAFTVLLEHPALPLRAMLPSGGQRRLLIGLAMGATAVLLIYSPLGKRSGAHMNPATTLAFLALRKLAPVDAVFYVLAQFLGGAAGMMAAGALFGALLAHPAVAYVVTAPGPRGAAVAFIAEFDISLLTMAVVLALSPTRLARHTGLIVGLLLALYITVEAPLSGMSMNPARTMGSALLAKSYAALWLYFTAPPLGMLLAAALRRSTEVHCAKLHHDNPHRCIFCGRPARP